MATNINQSISNQSRNTQQSGNGDEMKDYTTFWALVAVIVVAILTYATFSTYYGKDFQSSPPASITMGSAKPPASEPAVVNP